MANVTITQQQDDICVLEFEGKLSIGEGDIRLREAVQSALQTGYRKIVLDLRGARTIDTSGLGELIRAKEMVQESGGQLALVGVQDKIQDVLEMTRLIGIFQRFGSADDALMEISNF